MNENNNSTDSMIKAKGLSALKTLIDTNLINLTTIKWVERTPPHTEKMAAPHTNEMK